MASMREVAERAGVGIGTVSRYLNGTGYVSEETGSKINAAIKELDYTPNELARNLFKMSTNIVAIIVPDLSHPFFSEFARYAESELYGWGYKTMVCNTINKSNREKEYLEMLKRRMVDGIITGVHSLDIEEYLKVSQPIIALDRYIGENIPLIGCNHNKGGELAAGKFIQSKCRYVVQVQGATSVNTPAHDRHTTLESVLRREGIHVETKELLWNRFDYDYFEKIADEILDEYPQIDGMFGSDLAVSAVLKRALERGIQVPEDLKLVAYDGTYLSKAVYPPMTVIAQPIEELAKKAVELILELIKGNKNIPDKTILEVSLQEGKTT